MALTALISVSDKTGIVAFAKALQQRGVRILSTGGTARLLGKEGVDVTEVAEITNFPEMLNGRVKTLHPKIHAALLARRDEPAHLEALNLHGIDTIDLLVVNLYPFEATVANSAVTLADAIENIDIGGPAMVRSAAKNWQDVAVLTDSSQYDPVLAAMDAGPLPPPLLFSLAVAAFNRIAQYDGAISNYLSAISFDETQGADRDYAPVRQTFPAQLNSSHIKVQDLRYGENPHQSAALYRDMQPVAGSLITAVQLQGKELSYNNIADADAAWECVRSFEEPACVIIKHANPCGVALGDNTLQAYSKALQTDPTSAFGGIIAFNRSLDGETAEAVARQFVEVVIAPAFSTKAREIFSTKPNVRLLAVALPPEGLPQQPDGLGTVLKRIGSGLLVQTADVDVLTAASLRVVSQRQPTPAQIEDLLFAWKVARFVKSNAIVFCKDGMTMGVGAGQMSRLDSARIAGIKAGHANLSLQGTAVASDAFFPFRDGLDVVADAGATSIIQPGGSIRDQEVIDAANERDVVMVFSSVRHFLH